jgi:ribosomal protein L21E
MKEGQRVKVVADDMADEKGFQSKYVGKLGTVIGFKPNKFQPDWTIPEVKLDDGTVICNRNIWYEEIMDC